MLKGRIKDKSELTVWAEYKDGFALQIRYTPRTKLRQITDACKNRQWDPKTHQLVEVVDNEKFYRRVAEELVINWRGLTPPVLRKLVDMEPYPEIEAPYSVEDCAELLSEAYDLDLWVQQIASDLEYYDAARRAAEEKNS